MNTSKLLVGYERMTPEGFAIPCFAKSKFGNTLYRALADIDENYVVKITGFEEIEVGENFSRFSAKQYTPCRIGDEWIDVFIWNSTIYIGSKKELFEELKRFRSEIAKAYPLSYLDLIEGLGENREKRQLKRAKKYLKREFGSKHAENWLTSTYTRRKYINACKVALKKAGGSLNELNTLRQMKISSNNGMIQVWVPWSPDQKNTEVSLAIKKEWSLISENTFNIVYEQELKNVWEKIAGAHKKNEPINGEIVGRVKGGFTVDIAGINAFLPASQVDIRPVRDIGPLMNQSQPFMILKMDRSRGNIVVSRRAILEESRAEQRAELVGQLKEGETREGVVKNILDYGAFVDLGGIDGLLHVTDMSWRRVSHPSQVLNVGDTVQVKIIRINPETQRISLGMKQLQEDPWNAAAAKYTPGTRHTGTVTNIAVYGAFIELEEGVEGLVHVSEMSWTKKNINPGKIVSTSQQIEVEVLDVDQEKRRISLGIKQVQSNPWDDFSDRFPLGSTVTGEVRSITEFGLFIGLDGEIDGMAHLSDLSWDKSGEEALKDYNKGDTVEAKILEVDIEKERISLGIKQLVKDTAPAGAAGANRGATVTCTVVNVQPAGLDVTFGEEGDVKAFIRKGDLSRERSEQRPERFAVGDKVDAMITRAAKGQYQLSIKALEIAEEIEAVQQYGSADTGASLGEILSAALKNSN